MAVDIGETMYYNISELVKFFHSFPHYDLQFDPIDPKFDPQSQPYLQSLILVAAVPVLWMLLWILIYLAYFCYLCVTCRKNRVEKSTKSPQPSRWFSFFFYVLVILMITVSFYSNEVIDHNAQSVKDHLHKIQLHTGKIQIQSAVILQSIDKLKDETAVSLKQEFTTSSVLDEQERPKLQGLADDMTESLSHANEIVTDSVQDALRKLTFDSSLSKIISDYEKYRHLATHAVSGFIILATILSMFSLACKKKGFILMCVALAVFNVILVWAGVGAYSALSVGTSDFCMDPTGYLVQQLPSSGMVPEEVKVLNYYLKCQPQENYFYEPIVTLQEHLGHVQAYIDEIAEASGKLGSRVSTNLTMAQNDVRRLMTNVLKMSSFTECTYSHTHYMAAIHSICNTCVVGETTLLGSYFFSGLILIILVFLMLTAAQLINNKRAYFEVDSQDNDFQSRDQNNRSDNPLYYRFSQISAADDHSRADVSSSPQPSAPTRSSPPPAYQPHKDFYSTYGNNGTMDSNTRVPVAASNDLNRNSNTFRT